MFGEAINAEYLMAKGVRNAATMKAIGVELGRVVFAFANLQQSCLATTPGPFCKEKWTALSSPRATRRRRL